MSNGKLTVKEDTHNVWKITSIAAGALSIIFFLLFWNFSTPFWSGIFRLVAFAFFAVAVLSFLKLMNTSLQVSLTSTEELLLISYCKQNEVVKEEQFDRDTIKKVIAAKPKGNLLLTYLQPGVSTFKISFTDTERNLYLFEFSGRPLLFDAPSQNKIRDFVHELGIET